MSENKGELSEVDSLGSDVLDDGDTTPDAEQADQVADGPPKNYGDVDEDENLHERLNYEKP